MKYLLAWLEPSGSSPYSGFRFKTVNASTDEDAMMQLLRKTSTKKNLLDVDPEELENMLDELYERGEKKPLLVYNIRGNYAVISMEEDSYED